MTRGPAPPSPRVLHRRWDRRRGGRVKTGVGYRDRNRVGPGRGRGRNCRGGGRIRWDPGAGRGPPRRPRSRRWTGDPPGTLPSSPKSVVPSTRRPPSHDRDRSNFLHVPKESLGGFDGNYTPPLRSTHSRVLQRGSCHRLLRRVFTEPRSGHGEP